MNPQPHATPSFLSSPSSHSHIDGETCPLCEQEIPPEKLEEISGKIALREYEQSLAITARLEQKYEAERIEAATTAKANLELERRESATREAAARDEAKKLAETAMAERLAASEAGRAESDAALRVQIAQTKAMRAEAEQKGVALQEQITALQQTKEDELTKLKEAAAAEAIRIHQEATAAAELLMAEKLAANAQAAADAATKAAEAESKLVAFNEQHEAMLKKELDSQREALETAQIAEINAIKAKAFEDNQKQVDKLTSELSTLEKKTNEELGEGAEIKLFEALKVEFTEDQITPIPRGSAGADIRHIVMLHGKECGTILYDSKNRGSFRYEHVAQLKSDQIADKADHAVLSTHKFPKEARHLHMHDGVVLASPARVVAVVTLIRQHMLQTHTLRMSGAERESKKAALYEFITSDRCTQYLVTVDRHAEELLEMQVKEKKAHDATWKKEGELLKKIQKAQSNLSNEISCIIGTADDAVLVLEDVQL